MSHPDVMLVNILLSTTRRVSLVKNKFLFCQLRVHYSIAILAEHCKINQNAAQATAFC